MGSLDAISCKVRLSCWLRQCKNTALFSDDLDVLTRVGVDIKKCRGQESLACWFGNSKEKVLHRESGQNAASLICHLLRCSAISENLIVRWISWRWFKWMTSRAWKSKVISDSISLKGNEFISCNVFWKRSPPKRCSFPLNSKEMPSHSSCQKERKNSSKSGD